MLESKHGLQPTDLATIVSECATSLREDELSIHAARHLPLHKYAAIQPLQIYGPAAGEQCGGTFTRGI